jgi:hypothetical protein
MWTNDIKNTPLKFGTRNLLGKAVAAYKALPESVRQFGPSGPAKAIRDEQGIIALETSTHIFVAKQSPYGDIVSVASSLWDQAILRQQKILMWIESSQRFYEFDPAVIAETRQNMRGAIQMTNFDLRSGINLVRKAALYSLGRYRQVESVVNTTEPAQAQLSFL